ncbi:MAG TPA: hypothetical protein VGY56_09740 [Verrucomicrobiae bacterium]|nr:hypothetical protein [Verrucomicrobiae bacterium]
MPEVGYTLQASHADSGAPIVSVDMTEGEAKEIIQRLWPRAKLWSAPGGRSFGIETQAEIDVIGSVLKGHHFIFNPEKHTWNFHVYLL